MGTIPLVRGLHRRPNRRRPNPLPRHPPIPLAETPSGLQALLDELRRRRVVRVLVVYVAVALAALQAFDLILPALGASESVFTIIVRGLVVGLPLALALSWRYDITPQGLVRTGAADGNDASPGWFSTPSLVVLTAAVVAIGVGWWWGRGAVDPTQVARSSVETPGAADAGYAVAVLPLENLSSEASDEYFSDGLTDEIRNAVGRIEGVRTAARSSTFALKGQTASASQLGRQLGVAAVLSGSVRKSGEDVRISVSLGTVDDGLELWSETFDAQVADVFDVQSRIATDIADALRMTLTEEDADAIAAPPTQSDMALDKYRWGRFNWSRRSARGLRAAIFNFEEALELDPSFPDAWAGLANAWVLMPSYSDEVDPDSALARADAAATRALDFNPDLAEAHASRGLIRMLGWDWVAAEIAFEKAISLDPSYATARQWYANMLMGVGRLDQALTEIRTAANADRLSSVVRQDEARILNAMGRTPEAIRVLQDVLSDDPNYGPASADAGWLFLAEDRFDDARNAFEAADDLAGRDAAPLQTFVDRVEEFRSGGTPQALPAELEALADVQPVTVAAMEVLLGRPDAGLDRLEGALARGSWELVAVGANPTFAPLRGDPRYQEIVRAVGVEEWVTEE